MSSKIIIQKATILETHTHTHTHTHPSPTHPPHTSTHPYKQKKNQAKNNDNKGALVKKGENCATFLKQLWVMYVLMCF